MGVMGTSVPSLATETCISATWAQSARLRAVLRLSVSGLARARVWKARPQKGCICLAWVVLKVAPGDSNTGMGMGTHYYRRAPTVFSELLPIRLQSCTLRRGRVKGPSVQQHDPNLAPAKKATEKRQAVRPVRGFPRWIQNPVEATPCPFESGHRHFAKPRKQLRGFAFRRSRLPGQIPINHSKLRNITRCQGKSGHRNGHRLR